MTKTADELLRWTLAQLPILKARLAVTHAAIDQARRRLA